MRSSEQTEFREKYWRKTRRSEAVEAREAIPEPGWQLNIEIIGFDMLYQNIMLLLFMLCWLLNVINPTNNFSEWTNLT